MIESRHYLENGLWKYDLVTGKSEFSQGIYKIFNLEHQGLKTHDALLEWICPDDIDCYTNSFNEKIKISQPFILNYRIKLKDGTIKYLEENIQFETDQENKVTSYYGIISDISNLIKLQEKREEEQVLINSILRTLPNLIFVKNIDAGFRFSYVNDKFASFYGMRTNEIIGKYDKDISTPEQAKECYKTDNIACKHNIQSPYVSVETIPITRRSVKYMQTIKFAYVINGTNYLICSAMDITDLVMAKQKAVESDKLKSAFLHTISHEIRTPINSIVGYSQLVSYSKDKDDIDAFCEQIIYGSEQLLHLVTDIVYLANFETVSKNLVHEDLNIESLFTTIKCQYENQVKDKHLNFIYTPHPETNHVYSNKDAIMQLIKCFLENAIKFTKEGYVSMGYDLKKDNLKIWVKDSGIGIEKKNLKNVFKRFFKLDEFTSGTGIGLYICQKIVKSMKGKIGIDSEPDKGTYIWAELPLEKS